MLYGRGGPSKNYSIIKKMLYDEPQTMHLLLQKLTDSIILYLNAQIAAGADAIMLFDSLGRYSHPRCLQEFFLTLYASNFTRALT